MRSSHSWTLNELGQKEVSAKVIEPHGTTPKKVNYMKRRTLDETIKLDVERLGKSKFDSIMVFSALNDFALSVCAQSIINKRPDIKRKDLIEELRNIITGKI